MGQSSRLVHITRQSGPPPVHFVVPFELVARGIMFELVARNVMSLMWLREYLPAEAPLEYVVRRNRSTVRAFAILIALQLLCFAAAAAAF